MRSGAEGVFVLDSVEKGAFYVTGSRLVFFLTGYVVYFVLGRFLLSPEQFGVYGIIIAIFTTVNTLIVNAVQQTVSKFVSERRGLVEPIKRTTLRMQLAISALFFLAFLLLAPAIAFLLNDMTLVPLIRLSGLIFFSHPVFAIFGGCLSGLRKFRRFALLEISYSVLKMVFIIGLVYAGFSVMGAVAGFIIASFIAVAIGIGLVGFGKPSGKFDSREIIAFAIPLFGFAIVQSLLLNIDLFAVKALTVGDADLMSGYYVAAQTIARLSQFFVFAITILIFPLVSSTTFRKQAEKTRFYIANSLRYSLLLLVPITVILAANAGPVISLVYSGKYLPGAQAMAILSFSSLFYAVFLILTASISSSGRPKVSTIAGFLSMACLFALSITLVPLYSIEGAAYASAISFFIAMALAATYTFLKFRGLMPAGSFAKIAIAGALMWLLSGAMGEWNGLFMVAKAALLAGAFLAVLVAVKEFGRKDIKVFLNMVR
jgi:O-antigen/teichoic acid export membrane protein